MVEATEGIRTVIELPRFGSCSYADSEIITFPWGLPGFTHLRRFLTLVREGQEHFVWLQSLDDLKVALPAADPWRFFPEYDPMLPLFAQVSLGLESAEDFVVLGIMVIPEQGEMTMNLLAPVVINLKTNVGRQVPLETGGYSVRAAFLRELLNEAEPAEVLAE